LRPRAGVTRPRPSANERGFTVLELLFSTGIIAVLSAIAVVQLGNSRQVLQGDAAMRVVLSQLTQARELAINQRRYVEVTFDTTANRLSVVREDTTSTTTLLTTIGFEGGVKYLLVTGLPDTPDAFGKTSATSFTSTNGTFASASGSSNVVKFAPDGTLVDWNGQTANGTIFLSLATSNQNLSARAVTVLGSTGRIRGFRWNGSSWTTV